MVASLVPAEIVAVGHDERAGRSITLILRDIARGGLAGLITGFIIAGLGGRIVMRVAALLVPDAIGSLTENGNRIGDITMSGSFGLVMAGGLFFGLFGATIWVVVSPWIPGVGWQRTVLAAPIAVTLTGVSLVQARNPDFVTLRHDVLTVVLLLLLVGAAGASISFLDGWLERRLPGPGKRPIADATYLALTIAGGLLIFPIVLGSYLGEEPVLGLGIVGVGLATLTFWRFRYRGEPSPGWLIAAGRGAMVIALGFGVLAIAPDVATAVGWT